MIKERGTSLAGRRVRRALSGRRYCDPVANRTATAFGAQVIRYSSVSWVALAAAQAIGIAGVVAVVHFLGPTEYGGFALLLFFAALVNLATSIAVRPGTLSRVFGASDDEDDEDEAVVRAQATERSLGTGLVLGAVVSALLVGIAAAFSYPVGNALLGGDVDRGAIAWAAAAGGLGALYRLGAQSIWLERRPGAFLAVSVAHPALLLAAVIPLVAIGWGLEGAIAGTAIGTAASAAVALLALRGSWRPAFDRREAAAILRRGPRRLPILGSFWVIDYMNVFLVSRFVAKTEVGVFYLASRFALVAAFGATSIRLALRPLLRTVAFAAAEEEHGSSRTRGAVVVYFLLAVLGMLLASALLVDAVAGVVPATYEGFVPLVPLIAAAFTAPTLLKVLNKSAIFPGKRRVFVVCVVGSAGLFVPLALVMIPWLGPAGAPAAMLAAFVGPVAYVLARSQRGARPLELPYLRLVLAAAAAAACGALYHVIPAPGTMLAVSLALLALALWIGIVLALGALPGARRAALLEAISLALRRRGQADHERGLRALGDRDREALRLAVVERRPLEEVAGSLGEDPSGAAERLVRALRRVANGAVAGAAGERDEEIGRCLFATGPVASRDSAVRALLRSRLATARELHDLDTIMTELRGAPPGVWAGGPSARAEERLLEPARS